jgi:hypothetical protein
MAAVHAYGGPHDPHVVVCTADDEKELNDLFNRLKEDRVPCCANYEPDFQGMPLTAIATAALKGDQRRPLRRLPLLE